MDPSILTKTSNESSQMNTKKASTIEPSDITALPKVDTINNESSEAYVKPYETTATTTLTGTALEGKNKASYPLTDTTYGRKNIEEISTHPVLVTETNINNTAIIDSSDIAISENVDTNTMNSSLTITKTVNESRETNLSSIPFLLMEMYLTESSNPNTKPD